MNETIDFQAIDEKGPQTYSASYEVTADELSRDEVAQVGTVSIDATVSSGDAPSEYIGTGNVHFTADLSCSRCADPYPFANSSSFHVTFRPRPEFAEENEEVEITGEEELDVEFYSEPVIPLRHLALEQVQLSIPMKPLCDEACLGLCSTCGARRGGDRCSCETVQTDERWGALKSIREELAKKKDI
jgi:uncharacterized protein